MTDEKFEELHDPRSAGWTNIKFDGWRDSMTFTDGGRSKVADMIRKVAFTGGRR